MLTRGGDPQGSTTATIGRENSQTSDELEDFSVELDIMVSN